MNENKYRIVIADDDDDLKCENCGRDMDESQKNFNVVIDGENIVVCEDCFEIETKFTNEETY